MGWSWTRKEGIWAPSLPWFLASCVDGWVVDGGAMGCDMGLGLGGRERYNTT